MNLTYTSFSVHRQMIRVTRWLLENLIFTVWLCFCTIQWVCSVQWWLEVWPQLSKCTQTSNMYITFSFIFLFHLFLTFYKWCCNQQSTQKQGKIHLHLATSHDFLCCRCLGTPNPEVSARSYLKSSYLIYVYF